MKKYILRPLKDDYETISVSVTDIEKALVTYPYKSNDIKKQANTFWCWNLVEWLVFDTISKWKEYWLEKINIIRGMMDKENMHYYSPKWIEDKKFQFLYDWLEQIVEYVRPYEAQYDLRNTRMLCELDCSSYKVILTGEVDWWMDWCCIRDCKTASSKWKEDEKWETACFQWRYYPFMQMLIHPEVNEIAFNYRIFTLQKTIQFQQIEHIVTREEAFKFVKKTMYEYLSKLKSWDTNLDWTILERM